MVVNSGIYKIINIIDNKVYIGSSSNLKNRINWHINHLKNGKHHNVTLQSDFNKFGKDNFKFEIIEYVEDKESLLKREQFWIDEYRNYDKFIYNILPTAGSWLNGRHSKETKNKMSMTRKIINKNNYPNISICKQKKVVNISTGKIFDSIMEASIYYNIDNSSIGKACMGKQKTAGNYKWQYLSEKEKE